MSSIKPFLIPKRLVWQAWLDVKKNKGSAGVDDVSIAKYEANLERNLYKLWNRMSSGSYFPLPVKNVSIPKSSGETRVLGIPAVSDRIAQTTVKLALESKLDSIFHKDSYGYRPNKDALQAIGITRQRCWQYDYVVEFDIRGLFDNIDHCLLWKAINKHCHNKWAVLYIDRWLRCPSMGPEGLKKNNGRGLPQGGVISCLLVNLFMHYAFDIWVERNLGVPFCRYSDDGLLHCKTLEQAKYVFQRITKRFKEVGLEIHPDKSGIVFCKGLGRYGSFPRIKFDFLGYTFKPRMCRNSKNGKIFLNFLPGVSQKSLSAMRKKVKNWELFKKTPISIQALAKKLNPILQGWYNYYGKYNKTSLQPLWTYINCHLAKWVRWKYKKLKRKKNRSFLMLGHLAKSEWEKFLHWKLGYGPSVG